MGKRHWVWLSFCDPTLPDGEQFIGVAVVRGANVLQAVNNAWRLGANPGGEVLGSPMPRRAVPPKPLRNRLLTDPKELAEAGAMEPDEARQFMEVPDQKGQGIMGERIEIYEGRRGLARRKQFRWRWVAANGRILATSSEGYNNRAECLAIIVISPQEPLEPFAVLDRPEG